MGLAVTTVVSTMDRFSTNPIVSGGCLEEKRRQFSSAMAVASAIAREFRRQIVIDDPFQHVFLLEFSTIIRVFQYSSLVSSHYGLLLLSFSERHRGQTRCEGE